MGVRYVSRARRSEPPVPIAACLDPTFDELLAFITVQFMDELRERGKLREPEPDLELVEYDYDRDVLTVKLQDDTQHAVNVGQFLSRRSCNSN